MEQKKQEAHFVLLPFMAQGHMIPMVDTARLLAKRNLTVTILISPYNLNRIKPIIDRAIASGSNIRISHLRFPTVEVGLPEDCESLDMVRSSEDHSRFHKAIDLLQSQVEQALRTLDPPPTCIISDLFYPWSTPLATRLGIPRFVFHVLGCFTLLCMNMLAVSQGFKDIDVPDTEYFALPGLPDRVEITKAQIKGTAGQVPSWWTELVDRIEDAYSEASGIVVNTFEELEPAYVRRYAETLGMEVWCVGPVSLCNEDELDKAQRGNNEASIDGGECLKWLDAQDPASVVYVCLGSLSSLTASQLVELGLGLEASGRPFVWVVRRSTSNEELELVSWLGRFEERVRGKGLVIHGWAPQVMILSHPSVGGFVTHCGWNSTLEGTTSGVPMMTWPVFADQFCNEKFIVNVVGTGVRAGVEVPVMFVGEKDKGGVQVKSEVVKAAIEELMDGGEKGRERRERARELGKKARRAMEKGGSSYINMTRLIRLVEGQLG
ncbi:UDP-Glycosyltransferase superfamily protein [Striga asiatica]|uniref:UDP-Glycosyltransferase superfamily protein n=1 Tax=Striga asiatica TaxID=4170 RepID=A0A5A7PAI0_STRAF|nr:UDP-Glycosyltransferase superfamily protein [Striga asiatica]